ncbi:hypothetical protein L0337_22600 [candidate division KSB1 bacterium]|nr:hypothetical protein [candidate division KSB1 bacterium]
MKSKTVVVALLPIMAALMSQPTKSFCQEELPPYLRDRGPGMPVSMFGTYVRTGELKIYPFYEYYRDNDLEYKPAEFGYGLNQDFRGRYRAHEGLLFFGYGISDRVAVEFEAAYITAELTKSKDDPSAMPNLLEDSGLGDVEGQIRWRWNHESATSPEVFNYFETVFPTGKKNSLIGTSDWELKLGTGLIKGFNWGTVTMRVAVEYDAAENKVDLGEYALEYLKKASERFRFFVMIEGSQDEVSLTPEIQWHVSRNVFLKANNGFGITSKATDFAPEVGIMFAVWP